MKTYNPNIRLVEQNWIGSLNSFIEQNRPFISDEFIAAISRALAQNGHFQFDANSGVVFNFEVAK